MNDLLPPPATAVAASPAAGAPAARRTGPGAVVRQGLLATVHVALNATWGLVPGVAMGVLLPLSASLVLLLLVGVPLLALTLALARMLGAAERARYAAVLGERLAAPALPPAAGAWALLRRELASGVSWRAVAWCLLLPVLGAVELVVVVVLWSAALAGLTLPVWRGAAPADGWVRSLGAAGAALGVLAGLLLLVLALVVARALAQADTALARQLLGASRSAALTQRVEVLTRTRADAADAADAERRRIERDLHDGAQQRLVALAVDLGMASAKMDEDPAAARELVTRAHGEAKQALAELRDLARGIHPAVLTDRGLDAALSALAARSPVPVAVDVEPAVEVERCSPTVEATAYFVVAEALTNVAKHARASRATVTVRREVRREAPAGAVRLLVAVFDDGRGGADLRTGTGLAGLERRVAAADGVLTLSSPAGGPTLLTVEIPCAS